MEPRLRPAPTPASAEPASPKSPDAGKDEARPIVRVQWRDKWVLVYIRPELAERAEDLAFKAAKRIADTETTGQMRRQLDIMAREEGLDLLAFLDQPDHADPLSLRVTVAFGPRESSPTRFTSLG
jgi:hypothetical protein